MVGVGGWVVVLVVVVFPAITLSQPNSYGCFVFGVVVVVGL